ncbi:DUF2075 domain-containing protein [Archangium violaceum]|uniref:DUF2075 domain-containing protein n=1 Tax=Archangium violaceum TaxID=83451 RepID=UPI002B2D25F3|nr:DUF2075 domain-containing protein [Archangium violaceum]
MERSYYAAWTRELAATPTSAVLGALAARLPFNLEMTQREAWLFEIRHLSELAAALPDAFVFFEFTIPRMGRRADVVLLYRGLVFVLEYKVGERTFGRSAIDQALGYALDLKNFHEASHDARIVPVLVASDAPDTPLSIVWSDDGVMQPALANRSGLLGVIKTVADRFGGDTLEPRVWAAGRYKPTPTIIEAAQALYRGHRVEEISRSEAGAENLTETAGYIGRVIDDAKARGRKTICFVTGVPGSGKTLAGLNIANERMKAHDDEHAVFLSGNGPLVDVLREALKLDALERTRHLPRAKRPTGEAEYQKACAFIQNIHHFRDDNLESDLPPVEKVVVFDEAQRAWGREQASAFMRQKRGRAGFAMSEPEFLLSVMDRHQDWCTVVCLIGGGQEINTGEAGLAEWLEALASSFPTWDVHLPEQILGPEYMLTGAAEKALARLQLHKSEHLHLSVSVRSFRAEHVSSFVGALIEGDAARARELAEALINYPVLVTRDVAAARTWLRSQRRANERAGLLASSNALRLKPEGVYVKAKIDPPLWFLAPSTDVRASDALEDVGTEFDVQGLELDWACVCWDLNLRRGSDAWKAATFKGTAWQSVSDPQRQNYVANSYRVLLTRARQGMVIFVPKGDPLDATREPALYDAIYEFLLDCGIGELGRHGDAMSSARHAV